MEFNYGQKKVASERQTDATTEIRLGDKNNKSVNKNNSLKLTKKQDKIFEEISSDPKAIAWLSLELDLQLACDQKGNVLSIFENAYKYISIHPDLKQTVWFDPFFNRMRTNINGEDENFKDAHYLQYWYILQEKFDLKRITKDVVKAAVDKYGEENKKDSVTEWLNTLRWDQQSRLYAFFHLAFGTPNDEYHAIAGANLLLSLAARLLKPGCKNDCMVIIEGKQGIFKSTALQELVGESLYRDVGKDMGSTDFVRLMQGVALLEVGELEAFNKAEASTIKRVLSTQVDSYIPKYANFPVDVPRRSILVGTTNSEQYLKDFTGNRRFIPVRAINIDLDWIKENRLQLIAEAAHRVRCGESWWTDPPGVDEMQETRREEDPWEEKILDILDELGVTKVTASMLFDKMHISIGALNQSHYRRLSQVMQKIGWERKVIRMGNKLKKGYAEVTK